MKEQEQLYKLNQRTINVRYSREYLIGSRVLLYLEMIRKCRLRKLFKQIHKDLKTAGKRRGESRREEDILSVDFDEKYVGGKLAVYTSIYGGYDKLCEPLYVDENCDYFVFTDMDVPSDSVWKKIDVEFPPEAEGGVLKNRYVKMFPHIFFPDHQCSLYIDGNITIVSSVSLLLNHFDSSVGIAMHKHSANDDLYDEVDACLMTGKISANTARVLKQRFREEDFPKSFGMFECNVILRKHHNAACMKIMDKWWAEFLAGAKRDQLYFTYALFKSGYICSDLDILGNNMNMNPMFIRETHN